MGALTQGMKTGEFQYLKASPGPYFPAEREIKTVQEISAKRDHHISINS